MTSREFYWDIGIGFWDLPCLQHLLVAHGAYVFHRPRLPVKLTAGRHCANQGKAWVDGVDAAIVRSRNTVNPIS